MDGERERLEDLAGEVGDLAGGVYRSALETAHIISAHILLARTKSCTPI